MWNRVLEEVFGHREATSEDESDWPISRQINIKAVSYTLTILVVILAVSVVAILSIILGVN